MNLANKYKPRRLKEVIVEESALNKLKQFVTNFKKGKAVIIYGKTGSGKTASVYALANELMYEVLELNASDFRDKESMMRIIGEGSKQRSLFSKGKVILIDDVDTLNIEDRGGIEALNAIIKGSEFPIVMTATDPYISKLSSLRKSSEVIEFKAISNLEIFDVLRNICKLEAVEFEENKIRELSKKASGDLRGAINDLQVLINNGKLEDLGIISERERKQNIFNILQLIFKSKDANEVLKVFDNLDIDLDEAMLWIEENLVYEYDNSSLKNAFEMLSRADVFRGRIKRRQYWRFLVYESNLMSAGVALAKEESNGRFTSYKRPSRLLKYWIAKQRYAKKKSIAEKIANATNTSVKKVLKDFYYYTGFIRNVKEELELNEDEIEWLKNIKAYK